MREEEEMIAKIIAEVDRLNLLWKEIAAELRRGKSIWNPVIQQYWKLLETVLNWILAAVVDREHGFRETQKLKPDTPHKSSIRK